MAVRIFEIERCGPINSVREFLDSLFELRKIIDNDKLLYRGEANPIEPLLPTAGRKQSYFEVECYLTIKQEMMLLHRFRRRAFPHIEKAITAGEAIFLARHYGLPTRLLDWTANALYGLYFSSYKEPCAKGSLWAIRRVKNARYDLDVFKLVKIEDEKELLNYYKGGSGGIKKDGTTNDALKIVWPIYGSERIVSQDGAFTYHSNPKISLEEYAGKSFRPSCLDIAALYHWEIPSEKN
jgi:hypothetical protein